MNDVLNVLKAYSKIITSRVRVRSGMKELITNHNESNPRDCHCRRRRPNQSQEQQLNEINIQDDDEL